MKITQLRNATVLLEFRASGQDVVLLVDPMLARRGELPSLKLLGGQRRRNPIVDLPPAAESLLARVTHGLITHCQRGHFDHLDRAGKRFLRERAVPVFCTAHDDAHLRSRGLLTLPFAGLQRQAFFDGHITPVRCLHGRGWVGRLMEHGVGYVIELPGEPSVYLAGDTVLTDEVSHVLRTLDPDVSVLPAGGARFDLGGEILMNAAELCAAAELTGGTVIANHLEALDHCPVTRHELRQRCESAGIGKRVLIPDDGETLHLLPRRRAAL